MPSAGYAYAKKSADVGGASGKNSLLLGDRNPLKNTTSYKSHGGLPSNLG